MPWASACFSACHHSRDVALGLDHFGAMLLGAISVRRRSSPSFWRSRPWSAPLSWTWTKSRHEIAVAHAWGLIALGFVTASSRPAGGEGLYRLHRQLRPGPFVCWRRRGRRGLIALSRGGCRGGAPLARGAGPALFDPDRRASARTGRPAVAVQIGGDNALHRRRAVTPRALSPARRGAARCRIQQLDLIGGQNRRDREDLAGNLCQGADQRRDAPRQGQESAALLNSTRVSSISSR